MRWRGIEKQGWVEKKNVSIKEKAKNIPMWDDPDNGCAKVSGYLTQIKLDTEFWNKKVYNENFKMFCMAFLEIEKGNMWDNQNACYKIW